MDERPRQSAAPVCEEERQELLDLVEKAHKLAAMTRLPGWNQVLRPMLQERRQAMLAQVCVEPSHENVLRLQAGIQELDAILGFVATTIDMAQGAQESLEAENDQAL